MVSPGSIEPTDGYNYERVDYEGTTIGVWDLSGNEEVILLKKNFI